MQLRTFDEEDVQGTGAKRICVLQMAEQSGNATEKDARAYGISEKSTKII